MLALALQVPCGNIAVAIRTTERFCCTHRHAYAPFKLGTSAAGTSLYRSSGSDTALTIAQRLGDIPALLARDRRTDHRRCAHGTDWHSRSFSDAARRFKKQIFLSIDVPPSLGSMGLEGKLLLAIERAGVDVLRSDEAQVGH